MKRLSTFGLVLISMVLGGGMVRADVAGEVKAVLGDKLLQRAKVGVQVVRLGATPGETRLVYSLNGETPMTPASNMKVVTTSAALDKLGGDFKFKTYLLQHEGDLVLVGDGDPTLGDVELFKKLKVAGWDVTTVFKVWAEELRKQGMTSVRNVLVDDSVFDEQFHHPLWTQPEELDYVAQCGGLNLNGNCVMVTVHPHAAGQLASFLLNPPTHYVAIRNQCVGGGQNAISTSRTSNGNEITLGGQSPTGREGTVMVTVNDPSMYAATVLAETVLAAGVRMTGTVKRDRTLKAAWQREPNGKGWNVLAVHETPLATVLGHANKNSANMYAECLCKRLGYATTGAPGSWANGTTATGAFLQRIGVPAEQFHLDDGCGLAKQNTISPSAMTKVLAYDYHSKNFPVFFDSLSVAGSDGTLKERFKAPYSDLRGRVFGKTGFIEGVSALSGYLKTKNGQVYAFSILMNGIPHLSNSQIKVLHERIVKAVEGGR